MHAKAGLVRGVPGAAQTPGGRRGGESAQLRLPEPVQQLGHAEWEARLQCTPSTSQETAACLPDHPQPLASGPLPSGDLNIHVWWARGGLSSGEEGPAVRQDPRFFHEAVPPTPGIAPWECPETTWQQRVYPPKTQKCVRAPR